MYPQNARRRRRWRVILVAVLCLGVLLALCGVGAIAIALRSPRITPTVADAQVSGEARDSALRQLLSRRSAAVRVHDKPAFLADVSNADWAFAARQATAFDNLAKLPLTSFDYELNPERDYDSSVPADVRERYRGQVHALGVSVYYQIEGVDGALVAAPWVPTFALISGRWKVVGQVTGSTLPGGLGGQPWDADPITVSRSARVVGVFSAEFPDDAPEVLRLSEKALDGVAAIRPSGWSGRLLLTAVRDRGVFDAFFGRNPDQVAGRVAAIAVPHFSRVPEWAESPDYVATRVVFNPVSLSADPSELLADLAHEFTHVAMGPVTGPATPIWLVEGLAEYVGYKTQPPADAAVRRILKDVPTNDLISDRSFYRSGLNYVGAWLVCRMIAERYGQPKLIALYEHFFRHGGEDNGLTQVLGVTREQLIKLWQAYIATMRA
jgi:hypothetical protein